jgi:hypothetical protein
MKKALVLWSLLALSGCAPTRELRRTPANESAQEVIDAVNSRRSAISTLEAKGTISVESPQFVNSGSFELRLKRPDSVLVDVEGPFGIHVASALFAKGHYKFYNSFKNEVMEGEVDAGHMPEFMNIPIDPRDVVDMFCGTRTFLADETSPDSFSVSNDSYVLYFRQKHGGTRYTINDQSLYITGIEHVDSAGDVWSEEHFDYETHDDGTSVLQSIRLVEDKMQSSIALYYDKLHLNLPVGPLTIQIPDDARRVTKE